MRAKTVALALVAAMALPFSPGGGGTVVAALTLTVTKTADTADGACDADCSLREAIIAANEAPGHDTISVPAGTYELTIPGDGWEEAAATGDLDVRDDVTITGAGALTTSIVRTDGGGRVFQTDPLAQGRSVAMSGVMISGGAEDRLRVGGGIMNAGHLTLTDVAVSGNASGSGAGIFNGGGATLIASGVTVSGNDAEFFGGGIDNAGTMTLTNSTVSGNTAGDHGGGIAVLSSDTPGTTAISSTTVTENEADANGDGTGDGGGIFAGGAAVTILSTIVAGNGDGQGGNPDCGGTALTSAGYNLIGDASGCSVDGDATGNITGMEAGLGPLAEGGGPTQTHSLLPGSPAINAASPACPPPAADQRGVARPIGAACDIGAFESERVEYWGDTQCDGDVDSVDSLGPLRFVAALSPLGQSEPCPGVGSTVHVTDASEHRWGDVDCDRDVDSVDALKLLRYVAVLPVARAEPCPDVGSVVALE